MDSSSVTSGSIVDSPADSRRGIFVADSGQNVLVTFLLLLSLFALWGFCNGMIDVMDKHFQERLHLSLAQSAQVQRAHYLGYLLMAIPAGWLATKLGYKGGIIVGLLMVSVGGFWFYPATQIDKFWAFLVGVCFIAAGLTFLETIANPYATILGPQQYSATRINLAQSTNGFALPFGAIVGGMFFYDKEAGARRSGFLMSSSRWWFSFWRRCSSSRRYPTSRWRTITTWMTARRARARWCRRSWARTVTCGCG